MQVKVYYFRDYENHFVKTYGIGDGTKRYRDITFPIDDGVHVTKTLPDHTLVAELEYTGPSTDVNRIAEWVFMVMNNFTLNPLSAGYGLPPDFDMESLSADQIAGRRQHNAMLTVGVGTGHTSMSIGDVVEIDGRLLVAADVGFIELM